MIRTHALPFTNKICVVDSAHLSVRGHVRRAFNLATILQPTPTTASSVIRVSLSLDDAASISLFLAACDSPLTPALLSLQTDLQAEIDRAIQSVSKWKYAVVKVQADVIEMIATLPAYKSTEVRRLANIRAHFHYSYQGPVVEAVSRFRASVRELRDRANPMMSLV